MADGDFTVGSLTDIFNSDSNIFDLDPLNISEGELCALDNLIASTMGTEMVGLGPEEDELPVNMSTSNASGRGLGPEEKVSVGNMSTSSHNRFKKVDEEQMKMLEASRQSESTKKNTKWGVKMFQGK